MPILETSNLSNDIEVNHETDMHNNMKDFCLEKSNLDKLNSHMCSKTSVKLDSNKVNQSSCIDQMDNHIKNERRDVLKINRGKKLAAPEISKSKYGVSFPSKSTLHNKHLKRPLTKRKFVPVGSHLTNASAKVVLFERNVEIKDLESKVKYLQNKIKELENENKTLQSVQTRQERELKKFKEGVADIPSLLRSHKEETKMYESTLSNIRRELRDCQKDIKVKNEALLKKESHVDKLNVTLKRYEKNLHDISCELKELKTAKRDLEDENKMLLGANENLKCENGNLQKKVKCVIHQMQSFEENFTNEKNRNKQLKDDLDLLQKKYEDMQLQVSSKEATLSSDELVNGISVKEDLSEVLTEGLLEDNTNSESNKTSNLLSEETIEIIEEKEICIDKTKDCLIHTLKRYQDLCNTKLSNNSTKTCGVVASNLKLLPPLKQPCRKYSHSDLANKDFFSSSGDIREKNGSKEWKSEELAKYFHSKLKINETPIIENKILTKEVKNDKNSNLSEISNHNNSQSYLHLSQFDSW